MAGAWDVARCHAVANGIARDLDVVEIFSGVQSVVQAARALGLMAAGFDIENNPEDDIYTDSGMERAVILVARLKKNGLCHMAAECRTYCGLCCKNSGRTKLCPQGNNSDFTKFGNLMAQRTAVLFEFAFQHGLDTTMENPDGNFFWSQPVIKALLHRLDSKCVKVARCRFRCQGPRYKKMYRFESPSPWLEKIERLCKCSGPHATLATTRILPNGKKQFSGKTKDLKASASYPPGLGKMLVNTWYKFRRSLEMPSLEDDETEVMKCFKRKHTDNGADDEHLLLKAFFVKPFLSSHVKQERPSSKCAWKLALD